MAVDTVAPIAPTIALVAGDDQVTAGEQNSAIQGTAEANASVALTLGTAVRSVKASSLGDWTYTLTGEDIASMGQGAETLSATATDEAGNTSSAAVREISIDLPPPTLTSLIDDVTNFDVTSAIVLQASEPVTAVAGKSIRIMNNGGAGFRGEAGDNDQTIDVGSAAVTVQGNLIIIRPPFDLDLANDYHVEVDAGAFVAGGLANVAVSDPAAINFSTVVPGNGLLGVGAAAQSQAMDTSTGALQNSFKWLDIEGVGSPSAQTGTVLDLLTADVALVFKDYDPAPGSVVDAFDGVGAPDFYVAASNFGTKDLLYIDSQVNNAPNDLAISSFGETFSTPPDASLSFGTGIGGLCGVVEFPSPDSFADVGVLLALMASEQPPIISG